MILTLMFMAYGGLIGLYLNDCITKSNKESKHKEMVDWNTTKEIWSENPNDFRYYVDVTKL